MHNVYCLAKELDLAKRLAKRSIRQWEPVCIIYRNIKIVVVLVLSLNRIDPEILEIANQILDQAESVFGTIDRSILFPLADHIYYAVKRIKKKEQISNPLTEDIRLLFHMEYKVAACIIPILQKKYRISIGEDEVGYIALHVHSAIDNENVSDAIQIARAVRACVQIVEEAMDKKIDVLSLSYNRLMNHVRYMIVRAIKGEKLKMSLNRII